MAVSTCMWRFYSCRADGATLAELAVPPSLLGALPPFFTVENDLKQQQRQQKQQREQHMLKQGLAFLDAWTHARDNQTLRPYFMGAGRQGETGGAPWGLEDFGCPETLVQLQVEPLPDGVLLLFMEPEEFSSNGSSNHRDQQLPQHTRWPEAEGIELRLAFSDVRPMKTQQMEQQHQQQQQQQLHVVALRRSAGAAALYAYGPGVYRHLQDAEQRILRKLQQDLAAVAAGGSGGELHLGETPLQQQQEEEDASEKLIRMEQLRFNAPALGVTQQRLPSAAVPPDDGVRVVKSFPSLQTPQKKGNGGQSASVDASPGDPQQRQQQGHCCGETPEACEARQKSDSGQDSSSLVGSSKDSESARKKMGIKLLDFSAKTAAVPSFMANWSPEVTPSVRPFPTVGPLLPYSTTPRQERIHLRLHACSSHSFAAAEDADARAADAGFICRGDAPSRRTRQTKQQIG